MRINREPLQGLSFTEEVYKDYIKEKFLKESQEKEHKEAPVMPIENAVIDPSLPTLEVPETLGKVLNFLKESQEKADKVDSPTGEESITLEGLENLLGDIYAGEPTLAARKMLPIFKKVSEEHPLDTKKAWGRGYQVTQGVEVPKSLVLSFHKAYRQPSNYVLNLSKGETPGFSLDYLKVEHNEELNCPELIPVRAHGFPLETLEDSAVHFSELQELFKGFSDLVYRAENEAIKSNREGLHEALDNFTLHYYAGWELQEELEDLHKETGKYVESLGNLSKEALAELEEQRPGIHKEVKSLYEVTGLLEDTLSRELGTYTQAVLPYLKEAAGYRKTLLELQEEEKHREEEKETIKELLDFMS